ncbi:MAG TPA: hypothetical protein PLB78_06085, partial [Anaerolineae bacterium]|nr:hypothetical protein [Anaerolineae bacterium]
TLDQHTLTIAVQDDLGPEVFWYLREFPVRAIRPGAAPTTDGALLLSAGQDTPALSGYVRQRYRLGTSSAAPLGSGRAALSMWLIGEGGGPVQPEAIELWVKP